ncbi:MAG: hypothetical protein DSM106950_30865 [Stigonema ocellatum SAG 48.90 = DSM 106950]|nr:hypothetical protein [Stigonema ocellatum SAG 48.90 = DSM 106950]
MSKELNLVKFFEFIKQNNQDLNADHYQIAFRPQGLSVHIVLKYIKGNPDKEVVIGDIGL